MPDTDRSADQVAAYENRDVKARHVYIYGGGILVVLLVFSGLFINWFFKTLKDSTDAVQIPAPAAALKAAAPQAMTLSTFAMYPARDLAEFRQAEDDFLSSYGWADPQAGMARIPIQRAMDLLVENGLPAVPPAETAGEKQP